MGDHETTFRVLRADEEDAGYGVIVESVAWQKRARIDLWDRPLPRDVYARRQVRGENFGLFRNGNIAAVLSLVRGAPGYWEADIPDPHAVWLCTLATAEGSHGSRVGRATVEAALDCLRRRGEPEVWLDCKPGFLESFYTSLGFLRVRERSVEMCRPDLPCRCVDAVLMRRDPWPDVRVRNAVEGDIPAMAAIRGREALHRDRIRASDGVALRYLVIERAGTVVGFGCLVLRQPATWPPMPHLPEMVDLNVAPALRGQGLGGRLIREMERLTRGAGFPDLGIAVDPAKNPRALVLYCRLGYNPFSETSVEDKWEFTDSDGVKHEGREMLIFLRKKL